MSDFIQDEIFIVFGEDYDRHPHALEHVMRPLFEKNEIIWVETIGLRSPKLSFYDVKRIIEKLKTWFRPSNTSKISKPLPEKFYIVSPFMIPFNQFALIRKFNQYSVEKAVSKELELLSKKAPILITSVPNACDYIGHFNEKFKLYYCVDEFSLWPGLDLKLVKKLEDELLARVDRVVATSDALAVSKTKKNFETPVIGHGVDFNHFSIGPKAERHAHLNICSFGLIDERLDQELIHYLAATHPQATFHFIGPVVCDIEKLKMMSNIVFYGRKNYIDLPELIKPMDIFLLPYIKSELTRNINPLKLKEYLATGRPVLATGIAEVIKLRDYLFVIESKEQAKDLIAKIELNQVEFSSAKVIDYIQENETWASKTRLLCQLIKENI